MATSKVKPVVAMVFTLVSAVARAEAPLTIFGDATPRTPVVTDTRPVSVGVKFLTAQAGKVWGVRFFRGAISRSGYVVKLFAANGSLLAAAKTWKDTCSVPCWEQVNFASPISLTVNTAYVAAYYTPNGGYAADKFDLTSPRSAGPLTVPASAAVAGNGVYTYSEGFPGQGFEGTNYYVDVAFTPVPPGPRQLVISFDPPSPSIPSDAPPGTVVATVSAKWSDGTPFTGTLGFAPPYFNGGGVFAIQGDKLIVNPEGPGAFASSGIDRNVTIRATSVTSASRARAKPN